MGSTETGSPSPAIILPLTGRMTGQRLRSPSRPGPDFEKPKDANEDNVYEVTLVVTDSIRVTGEYDVTVKGHKQHG